MAVELLEIEKCWEHRKQNKWDLQVDFEEERGIIKSVAGEP